MTKTYDQVCGLARGLDVLGERWTLLLVRDLLLGPKRFTDLEEGLPGIPPSLLSARLKELQEAGLIARRTLPRPAASTVYELTEAGRALEETIQTLGRWGMRYGRPPKEGDAIRAEWAVLGMEMLFRPEAAAGVHDTYEMSVGGECFHAEVDDGSFRVHMGPAEDATVRMTAQPDAMLQLFTGELDPRAALESGRVEVEGDPAALERMFEIFRLVEAEPAAGATTR